MKIELNIPDDKKDIIIDGLCYQKYKENIEVITIDPSTGERTVDMEPNPMSKGTFAKGEIISMIKERINDIRHRQVKIAYQGDIISDREEIDGINIT